MKHLGHHRKTFVAQRLLLSSILALLLISYSCGGGGGGDGGSAEATDTQAFNAAVEAVESGDMNAARGVLEDMEARGVLGANGRALYAAVQTFNIVETAQAAGSALNNMLTELQVEVVGDTFDNTDIQGLESLLAESIPSTASATVLSGNARAAALEALSTVDQALAMLDGVEGEVLFVIEGYEVDTSDMLASVAALRHMKFDLEFALAYDLATIPEGEPFRASDLSFASDAATRFSQARVALTGSIAATKMAVHAVLSETDDQSDDLLTLDDETAAIWPFLEDLLDGIAASAAQEGFQDIPVFSLGDKQVVASDSAGETVQRDVFTGTLRLDLSVLFDEATAVNGAAIQDDLDAGLVDENLAGELFFHPDSYVVNTASSIVADVVFRQVDSPDGESTNVFIFIRTTDGTERLESPTGENLALDEAFSAGLGVTKSVIEYVTPL